MAFAQPERLSNSQNPFPKLFSRYCVVEMRLRESQGGSDGLFLMNQKKAPPILVEAPPLPFRFDNRTIDRDSAETVWVYPQRSYSGRSDFRQKGTSKFWLGVALWSAWSPNQGRPNGTLPNGTAEAPLRVEALPYVRSQGGVGALQLAAGDCPTNDGIMRTADALLPGV